MFTLEQLCLWFGVPCACENIAITGVSIDSRHVNPGDVFVALPGKHVDGHNYVEQAAERGAVAAIVSKTVQASIPLVHVDDTEATLMVMAQHWRATLPAKILALTGSCGKTTTRTMLARCCAAHRPTIAAPENTSWNNQIGVPLTLFRARPEHDYIVLELGANHVGEINMLSRMVQPSVAAITNVSAAHLEGFGNLNRIANAKAEIFNGLSADGTAILNADDDFFPLWQRQNSDRTTLTFAISVPADVRGHILQDHGFEGIHFRLESAWGDCDIHLPLPGRHNVQNALAAAAMALAIGVPLTAIKAGLEAATAVKGRLVLQRGIHGVQVLDDTYNANMGSVRAALEVLAHFNGRRLCVLGDFLELGLSAADFHHQIGLWAQQMGVHRLLGIGDLVRHAVRAFGAGGDMFADKQALLDALLPELNDGTMILVKGSRGSKMEDIVQGLIDVTDVAV